jgi:hypothetical protein
MLARWLSAVLCGRWRIAGPPGSPFGGGLKPPPEAWRAGRYITHTVRRFGNWTFNLTPPDGEPNTRLDLEPRVLFAPTPA